MPAIIAPERPDTPDAIALIDELQTHLESFYPPESRHGFSVDRLIKDGVAYFQAGAGVVADSVPEKEYQETLNKSKALLKAIEMAENGLGC